MSRFIAALPQYDWPEVRAENDAAWAELRAGLLAAGIDAPERLLRRNGDMPAVPGGIRDRQGQAVAPDPATLPPDEFDAQTLWRHPDLLLAQTCWGPMELGLAEHVTVVGQPSYDGIEGGQGTLYSSAILMRGAAAVKAPADGRAEIPIHLLKGRRFAYNSPDSMSGIIALSRDLDAMAETIGIFDDRVETGSHRASIVAVAEGRADACAIDCRSWQLAQRHEPAAGALRPVGWTRTRQGLPLITSARTPAEIVERLRQVLAAG